MSKTNPEEDNKKYDLKKRTEKFACDIIELCKLVEDNRITTPIVTQLIKAGTSIGANYHEADCAESRKDFEHKIGICKKESKESGYWLRVLAKAGPKVLIKAEGLEKESVELNLIFSSIVRNSKNNSLKV